MTGGGGGGRDGFGLANGLSAASGSDPEGCGGGGRVGASDRDPIASGAAAVSPFFGRISGSGPTRLGLFSLRLLLV